MLCLILSACLGYFEISNTLKCSPFWYKVLCLNVLNLLVEEVTGFVQFYGRSMLNVRNTLAEKSVFKNDGLFMMLEFLQLGIHSLSFGYNVLSAAN